ncbi:MAG: Ig-like domain-containing protein [Verrucomicrobia bacterium]|nr:Ig-like domain-containing protein [Verrucomicrobiota bacterium]
MVEILSPLPQSVWRETDNIPIAVSAMGLTAPISSVRIYDGERLVTTLTQAPFVYNWSYHLPGTRELTAVAQDELGLTTSASIEVTVTFDDDTLPPFLHYTFDNSQEGWIHQGAFYQSNTANQSGSSRGFRFGTNQDAYLSSPVIFLRQNETYTVEFMARVNRRNRYIQLAVWCLRFPGDARQSLDCRSTLVGHRAGMAAQNPLLYRS